MLNVLLVDDETFALEGMRKCVSWSEFGFAEPLCACSAAEARRMMEERSVQLVICDIEMAEENGLRFLEWVRERYPKAICYFLTCHAEFSYARDAVRIGVREYLLKPISSECLASILRKTAELFPVLAGKHPSGGANVSIEQVERYITENISNNLTCASVAEHFYLSADYLSRVYKTRAEACFRSISCSSVSPWRKSYWN